MKKYKVNQNKNDHGGTRTYYRTIINESYLTG